MDDLISRKALLTHQVEADRMGAMLVVGKGHILSAPTIDAVEVVRCVECKHSQPISERAARVFNAELVRDCTYQRGDWKRVYGFSVVSADGYCDEGERKEQNNDKDD